MTDTASEQDPAATTDADQAEAPTPAPVRVPNVSSGARSGLDHEVIGANAQAAHEANQQIAADQDGLATYDQRAETALREFGIRYPDAADGAAAYAAADLLTYDDPDLRDHEAAGHFGTAYEDFPPEDRQRFLEALAADAEEDDTPGPPVTPEGDPQGDATPPQEPTGPEDADAPPEPGQVMAAKEEEQGQHRADDAGA